MVKHLIRVEPTFEICDQLMDIMNAPLPHLLIFWKATQDILIPVLLLVTFEPRVLRKIENIIMN